jgi:hypothetical protein
MDPQLQKSLQQLEEYFKTAPLEEIQKRKAKYNDSNSGTTMKIKKEVFIKIICTFLGCWLFTVSDTTAERIVSSVLFLIITVTLLVLGDVVTGKAEETNPKL